MPRIRTRTARRCRIRTRCAAHHKCTGPARDALAFVRRTLAVEANAATDNPLVSPRLSRTSRRHHRERRKLPRQPVSQALDLLAIAARSCRHLRRGGGELVNPSLSVFRVSRQEQRLNSGFNDRAGSPRGRARRRSCSRIRLACTFRAGGGRSRQHGIDPRRSRPGTAWRTHAAAWHISCWSRPGARLRRPLRAGVGAAARTRSSGSGGVLRRTGELQQGHRGRAGECCGDRSGGTRAARA